MTKREYDWEGGAVLDEHTKRKHQILREYFRQYLIVRCQNPKQERFRLCIVDAFAGGGIYKCGSYGSPLIFLDVLISVSKEINVRRALEKMRPIEIECFLILNDSQPKAIENLKKNSAGLVANIKENSKHLHLKVAFRNREFKEVYPEVKSKIEDGRYPNVLFNLDQYGYAEVRFELLSDILSSWASVEIFLTFAIETLITFLATKRQKNSVLAEEKEILDSIYSHILDGDNAISKQEWLGIAERTVFENLKSIAPYVSPFSIHNPSGWRYWLIHFANHQKARQVYNDLLHENSTSQAHFGRSGLNMLSYNPLDEGTLYLFDEESRGNAINQLHDDIPRRVSEYGDALSLGDFYRDVYKETAAHSADIRTVIFENDELEVLTPSGNKRRKSHTSIPTDTLRIKSQRSFFPMFPFRDEKS